MTIRLARVLALALAGALVGSHGPAAPHGAVRPGGASRVDGAGSASGATESAAARPPRATASAPLPSAVPEGDPCDPHEAPPASDDAPGSLRPAARRVAVACALRDAMASRYVFWPVKDRLLESGGGEPLDPRAHFDACVGAERAIRTENEPLRFYDRMRRCVGAFEDGHLILSVPARLPVVALGVSFRLAGGRVVVANVEAGLVSELEVTRGPAGLAGILAPGAELLTVDGMPALAAVEALAALVPGSSPAARRERAVDALGRRDFAYPSRPAAALVVVAPGGGRFEVELPWWAAPGAERHALAGAHVARLGLATTELVDWRADGARDADAKDRAGARRTDPIAPAEEAAGLRVLRGEAGQVAVRLGELAPRAGGTPYCYAQLLSFHTETLADEDGKRPYPAVLAEFVRDCDAAGRDLVLDLRHNEGGYISHSTALARALAPSGAAAPGGALLLRATVQNERVYTARAPGGPIVGGSGEDGEEPLAPGRILAAIGEARRTNREFTPAFLERPLVGGGFGGRVVALTSPACMSACDRLAGLLRAGGRAVLVGGPTEGAGGSQQESKGLTARWTDPSGLLAVSIPNAAMGVQVAGIEGAQPGPETFFEALAFENRPVEPHVPYWTTALDLREANAGWRAAAEAWLAR